MRGGCPRTGCYPLILVRRVGWILLATVLLAIATPGWTRYTQKPVWPAGEPWPQYGNIAPLPGAGIAISEDGDPDGLGAMQMNIPVAYTPRWGYCNLSAYWGDYTSSEDQPFGNGSGVLALGFGGYPRIFVSGMQVSRDWEESKVVSWQIQIVRERGVWPAISMGMQDWLDKEPNGRSPYLAITRSLPIGDRKLYGTLGYGGGRFVDQPFAGVSYPLNERVSLLAEWDGFQFNAAAGWRPSGRRSHVTLLGGYNGRAGWIAGFGTVLDFTSPD